jgi:hypothetical protein
METLRIGKTSAVQTASIRCHHPETRCTSAVNYHYDLNSSGNNKQIQIEILTEIQVPVTLGHVIIPLISYNYTTSNSVRCASYHIENTNSISCVN